MTGAYKNKKNSALRMCNKRPRLRLSRLWRTPLLMRLRRCAPPSRHYPSDGLEERIKADIERRTGCPVVIETETDPSLIGGFRVVVNGMMLDASVKHQLELLKRQFIEKNNRLV